MCGVVASDSMSLPRRTEPMSRLLLILVLTSALYACDTSESRIPTATPLPAGSTEVWGSPVASMDANAVQGCGLLFNLTDDVRTHRVVWEEMREKLREIDDYFRRSDTRVVRDWGVTLLRHHARNDEERLAASFTVFYAGCLAMLEREPEP